MATSTLFRLNSDLKVSFKNAEQESFTFVLETRTLARFLVVVLFCFFSLGMGTLLFFREVERTRKLDNQILDLQIREVLSKNSKNKNQISEGTQIPAIEIKPIIERKQKGPIEESKTLRVQEFVSSCQRGICHVWLSMSPLQTDLVEGELLIVLEAEIPRIGTSAVGSTIRKRFFTYPETVSNENINEENILQLKKKPFRFSRALQTGTRFSVGELLRPIAATLYVYDKDKKLIYQERKNVESEAAHAQ